MENKELSLREIQQESLKVLIKFDEICKKEHLSYFLTYGTLIGAVRHHAFIPWDDDIDVMMPRQDYDKLEEYFISHKEELSPFELLGPDTNQLYPYMINRISNKEFMIKKDNEKDYGLGTFIDIYPLDGMGNSLREANKRKKISCAYASLAYLSTRTKFTKDNTKSKIKLIIKFPAFLLAKIIGKDYFFKKLKKIAATQSYQDTSYVGCLVWASDDGLKGVFEKKWFGTGQLGTFEGREFMIPSDYDSLLKKLFGDYMTPPPESDQIAHHFYSAYKRV